MTQHRRNLAGHDSDVERIAEALISGRSVVVVGEFGFGKSHLLSAVSAEVAARAARSTRIRAGSASAGEMLRLLLRRREGGSPLRADSTEAIILVDDADELDPDSVGVVVDAVLGGRASALFAMAGGTTSAGARGVLDLWMRGAADRHDLRAIDDRAVEDMMGRARGLDELDAVARVAVGVWAHGSRMLVRELAREAGDAIARDRDPLAAILAPRPGTSLSDAVAAHVERFDAPTRRSLGFLGTVPGIRYTDAVRVVPRALLDEMIARDIVWADTQSVPRLFAHGPVAHAAARAEEAERPLIDTAVGRLLVDAGAWWSAPLGAVFAARCFGGLASEDGVPEELVARSYAAAASRANDEGEYGLARDYCLRAHARTTSRHHRVDIELGRSLAGLGRVDDAADTLGGVVPVENDAAAARRLVRAWGELSLQTGAQEHRPENRIAPDPAVPGLAAEIARACAESALLAMDWPATIEHAGKAATARETSPSTRVEAYLALALAHAYSGRRSEAELALRSADRVAVAGGGRPGVPADVALLATTVHTGIAVITGGSADDLKARVRAARRVAVHQGDRLSLSLAGLTSGLVSLSRGDVAQAQLDVGRVRTRGAALPPSVVGSLVDYCYAPIVAAGGDIAGAWDVLAAAPVEATRRHRLLHHARVRAEGQVHAARGELATARKRMDEAITISRDSDAVVAYVGDVHERLRLGDADAGLLRDARHIVQASGLGHLHAVLDSVDPRSAGARSEAAPGGRRGQAALTTREREIAVLVSAGLSNREIADRLFLSVRTIETYVYQARVKLGAASRRDLARLMV